MKIFFEFRKKCFSSAYYPTRNFRKTPDNKRHLQRTKKKQQLPILLKREMINHNPLKINDNQNS